jgi:hypothetical protein
MARKPASKSKAKTARSAAAQQAKGAEPEAAKTKSGFGKRSMPAGAARSATVRSKPAKPQRKSVIGKAVEAVTSTVSSATALFKRRPAKSH